MESGKYNILLGITGGIAAYKSAELARLFVKEGCEVRVIMTRAACRFIAPLTFETLTGHEVHTEMFPSDRLYGTHHIDLADGADLIVVAPATANFLGKAANGIADDMLTTTFAAVTCPVLIAPAMNSNMWDSPSVKRNVEILRSYGFNFIGPDEGDLACGWVGRGRMVEPGVILKKSLEILAGASARRAGRLKGKKMLVTASGTREPIDAVRFISNRSSGRMGYAIAMQAGAEGAEVTLVSAPSSLPEPKGVDMIKVETAAEMAESVKKYFVQCDALVMAAAVADYTPVDPKSNKMKKSETGLILDLKPTDDILQSVAGMKDNQVVVGFALETDDAEANARRKLESKNLDFVVLNNPKEPGAGFDIDTNRADIVYADGRIEKLELMSKRDLASEIIDRIIKLMNK
jgi:phosphopantothenoylcysteine decarboxylase/phosphopantothenate--cysteine ligase